MPRTILRCTELRNVHNLIYGLTSINIFLRAISVIRAHFELFNFVPYGLLNLTRISSRDIAHHLSHVTGHKIRHIVYVRMLDFPGLFSIGDADGKQTFRDWLGTQVKGWWRRNLIQALGFRSRRRVAKLLRCPEGREILAQLQTAWIDSELEQLLNASGIAGQDNLTNLILTYLAAAIADDEYTCRSLDDVINLRRYCVPLCDGGMFHRDTWYVLVA